MECKNYNKLIELIKKHFSLIKLVHIGIKKDIYIEGIDINLCGKTNFNKFLSTLKNNCSFNSNW